MGLDFYYTIVFNAELYVYIDLGLYPALYCINDTAAKLINNIITNPNTPIFLLRGVNSHSRNTHPNTVIDTTLQK
jgi:hypothetical protein